MKKMKQLVLLVVIMVCVGFSMYAQDAEIMGREKRAVKKAALDYVEGFYEGNLERVTRALDTELRKVGVRKYDDAGPNVYTYLGYNVMKEYTRLGVGTGTPRDEWNIKVKVDAIDGDIATARIESVYYFDYVQVAKIEGEWKIINVLWIYR